MSADQSQSVYAKLLLQFFAGEIELRRGQKQEHEHRKCRAPGERPFDFRADLEQPRTKDVVTELLVFEERDHNA